MALNYCYLYSSVVVKTLCYKPEGGGSTLEEVNEIFQCT
jgi:hypothetical protein